MTKNQIEYWKNVETNRNNVAVETETNRSNLAREAETRRSNMVREQETNRSNLANENIARQNSYLNARKIGQDFYLAQKNYELSRSNLSEQKRHSLAAETELNRSNRSREELEKINLDRNYLINRRQQSTAAYNAETQRLSQLTQADKFARDYRVNLLNLEESNRANRAREAETTRSNLANEAIRSESNAISRQQMSETARANRAREQLQMFDTQAKIVTSLANTSVNAINATGKLIGGFK